jgi:acetylornithine deacetylase/succinyl-diaminopimelate desuccinylase-like protein
VLAEIRDLYGDVVAEDDARPADGQVFGMRTMPSLLAGDWACFFGEVGDADETVGARRARRDRRRRAAVGAAACGSPGGRGAAEPTAAASSGRRYGAAHAEAAGLVAGWMREAGLEVGRDATGNLIGVWPGREPGLPPSPSARTSTPCRTAAPSTAPWACWRRSRRCSRWRARRAPAPPAGGGRVRRRGGQQLRHRRPLGPAVDRRDPAGALRRRSSTATAAASTPTSRPSTVPGVPRVARPALAAYLEAHVEQGPVLDGEGGAGRGGRGDRRHLAHHGALRRRGQPRRHHPDAPAPRRAVGRGRARARGARPGLAPSDRAVATVGVFEVAPGATNVIPGARCCASSCAPRRGAPDATCAPRSSGLARACAERHGLEVTLDALAPRARGADGPALVRATRGALADAGLPVRTMPSWAGHDAKVLARRLPVGMVFVPSVGGVSHAPNEETPPRALRDAAELLLHAARRVDAALDAPPAPGGPDDRSA